MQLQRVIELAHSSSWHATELTHQALGRYRSPLLGLRLRVDPQSGFGCRQEDLEWVDSADVGGQGNHRDDTTTTAFRRIVGGVTGHDDRGTHILPFGPYCRIEGDQEDIAPLHHR